MTIQEAKNNYEVQKTNHQNAEVSVNNYEKQLKEGVTQVMKDMYGVEAQTVSVHKSVWSETVSVDVHFGARNSVEFRVGQEGVTVTLPRINEELPSDLVVLCGSLLMDYNTKTGGYSVIKDMSDTFMGLVKERRSVGYELDKARVEYEGLKRSQKNDMFYSVVKGGDIIKRNDSTYWKITKITDKCVYAISVDYGDVKSRRYKKEQFFNETSAFVNFEEVEG